MEVVVIAPNKVSQNALAVQCTKHQNIVQNLGVIEPDALKNQCSRDNKKGRQLDLTGGTLVVLVSIKDYI